MSAGVLRHDERSGAQSTWPDALLQRLGDSDLAAHPLLGDLVIALAVAAAGVLALSSQSRLGPLQGAFTAALCLPLLLRRRLPRTVFAGLSAIAFAQWLLADPQLGDAALLISLYGIALRGSLLELGLAGATMELGAVLAAARWAPSDPVKVWVGLSGLVVAAAVLGVTVRQRRALLVSLQERAARLELERDQEGRVAAAAERNRIAREMHDIVAHNLSVMITLADGASFAIDHSPERTADATRQISSTGREALLEMRRLLGILRDEQSEQPLAPQPGMGELEALVERVRAAGVPVGLIVEGERDALPDGVQLATFRVAQEALTNVLKHAPAPTEVRISLRCEAHRVELDVTNTGIATVLPEQPQGRGLRGMHERAQAYGGRLQAGPLPQGGWRVWMLLVFDGRQT